MGITVDSVAAASQEVIRNKQDPYEIIDAESCRQRQWHLVHFSK